MKIIKDIQHSPFSFGKGIRGMRLVAAENKPNHFTYDDAKRVK